MNIWQTPRGPCWGTTGLPLGTTQPHKSPKSTQKKLKITLPPERRSGNPNMGFIFLSEFSFVFKIRAISQTFNRTKSPWVLRTVFTPRTAMQAAVRPALSYFQCLNRRERVSKALGKMTPRGKKLPPRPTPHKCFVGGGSCAAETARLLVVVRCNGQGGLCGSNVQPYVASRRCRGGNGAPKVDGCAFCFAVFSL